MALKTNQPVISTTDGDISIRTASGQELIFEDLNGEYTLAQLAAGGGAGGLSWTTKTDGLSFAASSGIGYNIQLDNVTTSITVNGPALPSSGDEFAIAVEAIDSSPADINKYVVINAGLSDGAPATLYAGESCRYVYQGAGIGWVAVRKNLPKEVEWSTLPAVSTPTTVNLYGGQGIVIGPNAVSDTVTINLNEVENNRPIGVYCYTNNSQTVQFQAAASYSIEGVVTATTQMTDGDGFLFYDTGVSATGFVKMNIGQTLPGTSLDWEVLTNPASFTAEAGKGYYISYTATPSPNPLQITTPASPTDGDLFGLKIIPSSFGVEARVEIVANGAVLLDGYPSIPKLKANDGLLMKYAENSIGSTDVWTSVNNDARFDIQWKPIGVSGGSFSAIGSNGYIVGVTTLTSDVTINVPDNLDNDVVGVYVYDDHGYTITVTSTANINGSSGDIVLTTGGTLLLAESQDATAGLVEVGAGCAYRTRLDPITTDVSDLNNVQQFVNRLSGAGWIDGGEVTANATNPTTQIDVAAGRVFVKNAPGKDSPGSFVDFDALTGITVTQDLTNYVYVQYSGGSVSIGVTTDASALLFNDDQVTLNSVFPDGSTIFITSYEPGWMSIHTLLGQRFIDMATGKGNLFAEWAKGANIGTTATREVTCTEGTFYASMNRKTSNAIDTSGIDTMFSFYRDGVGGHTRTTGLTQLDNTSYDDGSGTLATLSNNNYTNRWMFLNFAGNKIAYLYGTQEFNTLSEAADEARPTDLPNYLFEYSVYLGHVVVQQGSNTTYVYSAFSNGDVAAPVQSHTQLSGLNSDESYQHFDGPEQEWATGWVDGQNITTLFNPTSRIVQLTGDLKLKYQNSTVFSGTSHSSIANSPGATQTQFYLHNGSGFVWQDGIPWEFNQAPVFAAVYNSLGEFLWGLRETHTNRRIPDHHRNEHYNIGTYRTTGLDLTGYVLNSTTAADRQPEVTAGTIYDDDLESNLSAQVAADYNNLYFTGSVEASGVPRLSTAETDIVRTSAGVPLINEWNGSSWTEVTLGVNDYATVWHMAVPATSDTTFRNRENIFIAPQNQSNTLLAQQSLTPLDISFGELINESPEFVVVNKIIIQRQGSTFQIVQVDSITGSRAGQVVGPGNEGTVSTDQVTIDGDGTVSEPISISLPGFVTTVDDATTTLTASDRRHQVATGSGINYTFELPDATTLRGNGDFFEFTNASSEFVGVENSDKSTWMRVPPGTVATFRLVSGATAAGIWESVRTQVLAQRGFEHYDDFIGRSPASLGGIIGWVDTVAGSGATVTSPSSVSNTFGNVEFRTGSTATGSVVFYCGTNERTDTGMAYAHETLLSPLSLSTVSEEYVFNFGWNTSAANPTIGGGAGLRYDRLNNGDFWSYWTNDGTESETVSTTAVTTSMTQLRVEIASDASRVDYWVDKVHLGSKTTNIPAIRIGYYHYGVEKTAGTGDARIFVDTNQIIGVFNSNRF